MATGSTGAAQPSESALGAAVALSSPGASTAPAEFGGYKSPADALEQVGKAFNDWSASLTSTSLQMCYAVIAADWIIYQKVDAVRRSFYGKWSMTTVMAALLINLSASYVMSWLHKSRYRYAEESPTRWADEFKKCAGTSDPFPYTKGIERVGSVTRMLKFLLPLIGGMLLIAGALKGK